MMLFIRLLFSILPLLMSIPVISQTDSSEITPKLEMLYVVPLLHHMNSERVHDIFEHGQSLGNRANVFVKVGDSNTTSADFLRPIGVKPNVCELGGYAYLQETIDFFSVSPRSPFINSFDSTHITAQNGLSTASALDPFWATDSVCQSGESPLACEYRVVKPSVAIIMLGLMDLELMPVENYRDNLDQIVQVSIEAGVIPVLTTYAVLPDYPSEQDSLWEKSIDLNLAIIEVAERYRIPVIHLWLAQQDLPNYGIGPDRTHLRHRVGSFCSFTGAETEVGGTLRNLLTLQALDQLRRHVLNPG